jgi:hypothetical protein
MPIFNQPIKKVVNFSSIRHSQHGESVQGQFRKEFECPAIAVVFSTVNLGTRSHEQCSSTGPDMPDL